MITYKSNEDFMNMKKAGKIVATIHAELQNISLPGTKIETLDKKAEEIIKIMEEAVELQVPNKVDYESGSNWGDIK